VVDTYVGEGVTLSGETSYDEDGEIITYLWNCTSHPGVAFLGQNTTQITFVPDVEGDFVFTLTVRDDNGSWSLSEDLVTVRATERPVNEPPVAVIDGPGEVLRPGDLVELDGSASYDPDGTIAAYNWSLTSHPLISSYVKNASVLEITLIHEDVYTFTLTVQDDDGA
jgi:hypothetical protein